MEYRLRHDGESDDFKINDRLLSGDEKEEQLHEWIISTSKLEEYDCELSDEEYASTKRRSNWHLGSQE